MHNRSRVKNKLSFRWFFRWRSREHPFLRGKLVCNLAFFFDLEFVFIKIPSLHSGTSLLSFSLFMEPVLKFHSVGTSLFRIFDILHNDGPLDSRRLACRSVDLVNRTLWIGSKTFYKSFNISLCTSSSSSFLFFVLLSYWFMQLVSPPLFDHTSTSFCCGIFGADDRILRWRCWMSRCRWSRRTRWYKGQRVVRSAIYCNWSSPFRWDVVLDRWSSGKFTHDPHVRGIYPTHMEEKMKIRRMTKKMRGTVKSA